MKIKELISSLSVKPTNNSTTASGNHNDKYGSRLKIIDNKNFYLDHVKYSVEEDHLIVSGYNPKRFNGVAAIAPQVAYRGNSYDVLKIGAKAFQDCTGLTSITFPDSVTSIGHSAFQG